MLLFLTDYLTRVRIVVSTRGRHTEETLIALSDWLISLNLRSVET